MEKFISQVPFRLEAETATKQSPRLHQPELIKEWVEFYPSIEETEPFPLPTHTARPWWNLNRGDDV